MKKTLCLLLCLLICIVSCGITVAWLGAALGVARFPTEFTGSADAAYFAGGNGSEEKPYEISDAVHLYNLAWLQYLGYFNMNPDMSNKLAQSYFKLTADIDMGRLKSAIPPIGTTQYPFIGHFDGGNFTIRSLTVSNAKGDTAKTLKVRPSNAEFQNSNNTETDLLHTTDKASEIEIVGLFGVTGNYNGYTDGYAEHNADFVKEEMSVSGFYADKLHVNSNTAQTLVGLVGGYIGSNFANVGVYRGDISLVSGVTGIAALSGGASVVSKYSLVGAYDESLVTWSGLPQGKGWGGSIDMEGLHSRLQKFRKSTPVDSVDNNFNYLKTDTPFYNDTNRVNIRYYNENQGSVYFKSSNNQYLYLYGGLQTVTYEDQNPQEGGFFISDGNGNYLTINNLTASGARLTAKDKKNAVTWYFSEDNGNGQLYTYNGDQKMYCNADPDGYQTINLSTEPTMSWERSGNQLKEKNGSRYLTFSSSYWRAGFTEQDLNFEATSVFRMFKLTFTYTGSVTSDSQGTLETRSFATYIPLNVDDNDNVLQENTGYIASGPSDSGGDIRVGYYLFKANSTLSTSLNGATTFGNGATLELLTRSKKSDGFVRISDNYNGSNTSINATIGTYDKVTVDKLGLQKYTNSRDKFNTLMLNKTQVYGLHFMNTQISKNNIYVAPKAVINNQTYTNYEMVANSIDFQVASRGMINFFAGTYYSGNKNFFSLHEVFRNSDNTISDIKEISKIYSNKKANNAAYVYQYSDGSYSGGVTSEKIASDYELEFDCDWITNPTMVKNAVYYFEIPVNKGEYALGSASTGNGAYLMYLDIGANGTDGGGSGEKPYTMETVDFVNTDTIVLDANNAYPAYKAVIMSLADVATSGTPYILYERATGTEVEDSKIATKLLYKYEGIGTLTVLPGGMAETGNLTDYRDEVAGSG